MFTDLRLHLEWLSWIVPCSVPLLVLFCSLNTSFRTWVSVDFLFVVLLGVCEWVFEPLVCFFLVSCIALPGSSFKECQLIAEHSLFCFHFFCFPPLGCAPFQTNFSHPL